MPTYNDDYIQPWRANEPGVSLVTVTIANNQSESDAFETRGMSVVGLQLPSAWTAADLAWKWSHDGTNFYGPVKDATGTVIGCSAAASAAIAFPQSDNIMACYLKLVSVTAADRSVAANQGGARSIQITLRRLFS